MALPHLLFALIAGTHDVFRKQAGHEEQALLKEGVQELPRKTGCGIIPPARHWNQYSPNAGLCKSPAIAADNRQHPCPRRARLLRRDKYPPGIPAAGGNKEKIALTHRRGEAIPRKMHRQAKLHQAHPEHPQYQPRLTRTT